MASVTTFFAASREMVFVVSTCVLALVAISTMAAKENMEDSFDVFIK
jgi:hypothetical protein